ncbi:MAG: NADH-quinone oxidoreductase subunit C [Candidatus Bathyarchaeota archaeon]|nr:NADH-quinone oxidoreductase subunit C [Candidatus Bathyarchaeota archaeon]
MSIKQEIPRIFLESQIANIRVFNDEIYINMDEKQAAMATKTMDEAGFELICLFCVQNFQRQGFTLLYAFEKACYREVVILQTDLTSNKAVSIAKTYASACWYEREITDGFGIEFEGAFDTRRLFLHESYPESFHPLLKEFKNGKIEALSSQNQKEYVFKEVKGEGVYQIPVGPVHAGIIEPGHFRFSVVGETIFNLEVRLFYKHRGLEKLAEGKSPQECVKIAETISGDETVANAVAFCDAVEKICETHVPRRALQLRVMLLELERVYSHLGDLAGMFVDVAYPAGASPLFILREEIFRLNEALTGSRFLKGIVTVGGLTRDIDESSLNQLAAYMHDFPRRLSAATAMDSSFFSVIDRFETTGIVKPEILSPLHITGPVSRAAGKKTDTRIHHSYGLYQELDLKERTQVNGDVLDRFTLKAEEVLDSVKLIQQLLTLEAGPVGEALKVKDGYALSLVEAARGQNMHWVLIKNGLVDRYKVRTASFCNWQAMEHAVLGNIVPDFPLINKSMNLSYAGTDL